MDRLHLIAEIFCRPALWDLQCEEYKCRINISTRWNEVAASMKPEATVDECKRKWKNLRDAYRAEIKRIELRIERDLLKGTYDPKKDYSSKWAYFEHMKFLKDIKRPRRRRIQEDLNTSPRGNDDEDNDELEQFSELHDINSIKLEPDIINAQPFSLNKEDNDSQMYCEKLLEESENQEKNETNNFSQSTFAEQLNSSNIQKDSANENLASTHCRCSKRAYDRVHFLENLEKEEHKLMKSMRLDISRSNDFAHVGDPDYNFLISFLPQIKKMNELQNLKFRAKMSDFVFSIMSQNMANNVEST